MNDAHKTQLANKLDAVIKHRIRRIWQSKVEVYVLLIEFKRKKLYRFLDIPVAPRHAARICAGRRNDTHHEELEEHEAERNRICAERRFPTWEDYLAELGAGGISFGYFAELERLHRRYGGEILGLCSRAGLHVVTRRQLLRCWDRTAAEVREVFASDRPDDEKVVEIERVVDRWESEHQQQYPRAVTPQRRVSDYRRHVGRWERVLSHAAEGAVKVPGEFRRGSVFWLLPLAWREVFERHLEIGERLAKARLSSLLGSRHLAVLQEFRSAWSALPGAVYRAA